MMHWIRALVLAASVYLAGAAHAQVSAVDLLRVAESAFERGLQALSDRPTTAKGHFAESAAAYEAIAKIHGVRNADLFANAGNAHLLSDDTGRAVAAYRRALRLEPSHAGARAGLRQAQERIEVAIEPMRVHRLQARLEWWLGLAPRRIYLLLASMAWVSGWGVLVLTRGQMRLGLPVWTGPASLSVAGLLAAPVIADAVMHAGRDDAVIIADRIVGRTGPDAAVYPPSFEQPLVAGLEGRIVERRRDWVRLRLHDGRETWAPASGIVSVFGRE